MLSVFIIMLCSFAIFKLSSFFTKKISLEIDSYKENENFNSGFVTRNFLSSIDKDLTMKFCNFFFLSNGYRELTKSDVFIPGCRSYLSTKEGTSCMIFSFDINQSKEFLSIDVLYEIIGILSERKIYDCVILCDYNKDLESTVSTLKDINITLFTPLQMTEFYWNNNNFTKECPYD